MGFMMKHVNTATKSFQSLLNHDYILQRKCLHFSSPHANSLVEHDLVCFLLVRIFCVIHYGIRFQCRTIMLATPRMLRNLSNNSRAPDGVCIALWFLGMTNPPTSAEVQGLSKLPGQRRHASANKHSLLKLLFSFLLCTYCSEDFHTDNESRKETKDTPKHLSIASENIFRKNVPFR